MKICEVELSCSNAIQKVIKATLFKSSAWHEALIDNPDEAKRELQQLITTYTEVFESLPEAEHYIENEDFSGFMTYTKVKLNDVTLVGEGLKVRVDHHNKIWFIYKEHLAKEPQLRLTPNRGDLIKYIRYYQKLGYLEAVVDVAQSEVMVYKKNFWDPAKKVTDAVQFLEPFVDATIDDLRKRVKEKRTRENTARFKW